MGDPPEWTISGSHIRGKVLNWFIGFVASYGLLMFGYDQACSAHSFVTLDSFQMYQSLVTPRGQENDLCGLANPTNTVPDPNNCTGDANTQAAGVGIYQIGCWMGSSVILFYGENYGRKSSTFLRSSTMIIGTIVQAASFEYGLFVGGPYSRVLVPINEVFSSCYLGH
ncbi:general substrate transporter [Penicillium soppii]|uniref:general substrate transporter n=1 Tax=Penicillium soppii TaxID=69789 RepID=UPI002546CD08|nr:general substrate transporter [Penicillium soppii]KAJ5872014.1 general substrate transporter [Penicillium soppii]